MGKEVIMRDTIKDKTLGILATLNHIAGDPNVDVPSLFPENKIILSNVQRKGSEDDMSTWGEVWRGLNKSPYVDSIDDKTISQVTDLIANVRDEMIGLEQHARRHDRLKLLAEEQQSISHILVLSRPGTYYDATKNDRYRENPAMFGADRLNADRAALVGMQIACLRAGWNMEEIEQFDYIAVIGRENDFLNKNAHRIQNALEKSGLHFVYVGRPDEARAIKSTISKSRYIPNDLITVLPPEGIDNTIHQVQAFRKYVSGKNVMGVLAVTDALQTPRFTRLATKQNMLPSSVPLSMYVRPTSTNGFTPLATGEIQGNVYYALHGDGSFQRAAYKVI